MSLFANSSVIELTPQNFKNGKIVHPKLDGATKGIISFMCSWCHFCRDAAPEFKKAAKLRPDIPFFSVDCVKYADLASSLKINSYPTIKLVSTDGKFSVDYTEPRTSIDFAKVFPVKKSGGSNKKEAFKGGNSISNSFDLKKILKFLK